MTITGNIRVGDDAEGYETTLEGEWTPEQVRAAFSDGYDWGDAREDASFAMTIWNADGEQVAVLDVERGIDYGDYPHRVRW